MGLAGVGLLLSTLLMVAGIGLTPLSAASASPAPGTGSSTTGPLPPGQDPFYRYSGTKPLKDVAPGTVLATRAINVAVGTTSTPLSAEQLLYRTTGELGRPTVTVTTVIAPWVRRRPRDWWAT